MTVAPGKINNSLRNNYLISKVFFLFKKITFLKFLVVGGTCASLDLIILYSLTEFVGLWYIYSGTISFFVVSVVSFLLNKKFTFEDKNENKKNQYTKYVCVIFVGIVINNLFLYIFTEFLLIWYVISRVLSSLVALIWNYNMSKKIIFK
jgi:putative flippase GtrA